MQLPLFRKSSEVSPKAHSSSSTRKIPIHLTHISVSLVLVMDGGAIFYMLKSGLTAPRIYSRIQLKSLTEEMQAIIKGLEKVKQELAASVNDGPVSDIFHKTLKGFIDVAESEVESLTNLYSLVGRNADALALYFGEDPARCPFEQVTVTLLNFVRLFRKAHEENCKLAELEKKKAEKEAEMKKAKGKTKRGAKDS